MLTNKEINVNNISMELFREIKREERQVFNLTEDEKKMLELEAKKRKIKVPALVREALALYFSQDKKEA